MSDSLQPYEWYNLPGFSVHGILWARIPEWVAMPSSRESSRPRDLTQSLFSPELVGRFFTTRTTSNMDSEPGKARWLAKGNPEEMPHKSDSNHCKGTSLSLWACLWVYPNILFFLIMNTLLVSLPISIWKFISTELWARALSLVTDLVARFSALTAATQSHWFMSVYGKNHYSIVISLQLIKINENKKPKKPNLNLWPGTEILLQAAAGWGHLRTLWTNE